jgi:hypothetical protein
MGSLKLQNSINITLLAEGTLRISWSQAMMHVSTPCFDVCLQVYSGAPVFHCL